MDAQKNDEIRDVLMAGKLVEFGLKLPEILILQALYGKGRQINKQDIQAVAEKLQMSETLVKYHRQEALAQVKRCQLGGGVFAEMFGTGAIDEAPLAPKRIYAPAPPMRSVVETAVEPLICRADCTAIVATYTRPEFRRDEDCVAYLSQEHLTERWSVSKLQRCRSHGLKILAGNGISVYHCFARVFDEMKQVQDGGSDFAFVNNLSDKQRELRQKVKQVIASLAEKELLALRQKVQYEVKGQSVKYKVIADDLGWKTRIVEKYFETIHRRLAEQSINPWTVLIAHTNGSPGLIVKD